MQNSLFKNKMGHFNIITNNWFWLLLIIIYFFSCEKEFRQDYNYKKIEITKDGGSIKVSNIELFFSEGAVDSSIEVVIQNLDSLSNIKFIDTLYFFRYMIGILPEGIEFLKPIKIEITDNIYWYKTFDINGNEIPFKHSDLKLYKFDLINKNILCINNTEIKNNEDSILVEAEINQSGYYGIAINKNKLDYWDDFIIATILFNNSAISDTVVKLESKLKDYAFCDIKRHSFSNDITTVIQITDPSNDSVYFSLWNTLIPAIGEYDIIWSNKYYNAFILSYFHKFDFMNSGLVTITSILNDEAVINYIKVGEKGEIIEGTLVAKGITSGYSSDYIVDLEIQFSITRKY